MARRLGISMRVEQLPGRPEQYDCLSHDWTEVLRRALVEVPWFPIPNLGSRTESYLSEAGIDALILSGGNSIGQSPLRDDSEIRMLDYCRRHGLPVLGVCRGLQVIHFYYSRALPSRVSPSVHAGLLHPVRAASELGERLLAGRKEVSSYHERGVLADELMPEFEVWALSADGVVEGLIHREHRMIASQWHPEREPEAADAGLSIIRYFYNEL